MAPLLRGQELRTLLQWRYERMCTQAEHLKDCYLKASRVTGPDWEIVCARGCNYPGSTSALQTPSLLRQGGVTKTRLSQEGQMRVPNHTVSMH